MQPLVYLIVGAVVIGLALLLQHERRQAARLVERSRELERLIVGASACKSHEERFSCECLA